MTLQKLEALADRLEAELAHRHRGTLELPKSRDAYEDGLRLCHDARAEIAALRVAGEGWQDISTAPRTVGYATLSLLGWCPDADAPDGGDIRIIWWENDPGCWWGDRDMPERPTKWRPLPAPPKEAE